MEHVLTAAGGRGNCALVSIDRSDPGGNSICFNVSLGQYWFYCTLIGQSWQDHDIENQYMKLLHVASTENWSYCQYEDF